MPSVFRIGRPGSDDVRNVGSVEAIKPLIRASELGRYHVDEISADPLPSRHTSRRWGTAIKRPDGQFTLDTEPWSNGSRQRPPYLGEPKPDLRS